MEIAQFSHSVMSNYLWLHGLQHARLPCQSPTRGICSDSCLSSRWCILTISFSVIPSLPAFSLSQGFFQWVSSLHQVAKVLELQHQFSSVQLLSHVQLSATPWAAAFQASLSITNSRSLLKLMSIDSVIPSNKEQVSFNFITAVTIYSDFGAQENTVCHCSYCFLIDLPWSDGWD